MNTKSYDEGATGLQFAWKCKKYISWWVTRTLSGGLPPVAQFMDYLLL